MICCLVQMLNLKMDETILKIEKALLEMNEAKVRNAAKYADAETSALRISEEIDGVRCIY
jgi:hypothetical protein